MKTIAVLLTVVSAAVAFDNCICTLEYNPVCGSDGITYENLCHLRCQQLRNPSLFLDYFGKCKLVFAKRSQEPCFCTKDYNPVCGSDAVTYANRCLLECARRSDNELFELYEGVCKKGQEAVCICTLEYFPICGSDGRTYGNQCDFDCAKRTKKDLYVVKYGEC